MGTILRYPLNVDRSDAQVFLINEPSVFIYTQREVDLEVEFLHTMCVCVSFVLCHYCMGYRIKCSKKVFISFFLIFAKRQNDGRIK